MVTVFERGVALVKEFMYLSAKVSDTGSFISITVASSGLSTVVFCLHTMFAVPISPLVENLTPSLLTEITTVSPILLRSLHILANSADGILIIAWYSASGIPRCSLSMSISFISKSAILSWLGLSNMKVTVSLPSSALMVMISSLPAHLSILDMLARFIPMEIFLSQR
uniref:Uncharacterized protein n=1 Tax=Opuntia streptacantha TaxID=393608 RepID=A0A7C9DUG3_OPUST